MPSHSSWITIVSGLPRSGTSMMMRMLEAGGMPVLIDHVRQSNIDNPGGYYEFEPVKQTKRDPTWLANASGKSVKMVYRLLYDLPETYSYRVLFMRRSLDEVLASQHAMLEREGRVDSASDREMAALFRSDLARFDKWIKLKPNFAVLDVDYNTVVTDSAPLVTEISEFLGGQLDCAAMCNIIDMSLYRNRREKSLLPS